MSDHDDYVERLKDWDGVLRVCLDCHEEFNASELEFGLCRDCRGGLDEFGVPEPLNTGGSDNG